MRRASTAAGRRAGSVAVIVLVSLAVVLMLVALAVDHAGLWEARGALENGADAAALAAAGALADDHALLGSPAVQAGLVQNARAEAVRYGAGNLVLGQPLDLDPNLPNAPNGDVVFGVVDLAHGPGFLPAGNVSDPTNPLLPLVNAVRVVARRTRERGNPAGLRLGQLLSLTSADVVAAATATLDRDVIGFRSVTGRPIPLVPIAILSDPTRANALGWEAQAAAGPDQYLFDPVSRAFWPGSDGLREVQVQLGANACLVQVGTTTLAGAAAQVSGGVLAGQAPAGLVLGPGNRLTVPAFPSGGPAPGTADEATLGATLARLQASGELRAWPLCAAFDPAGGTAVVSGFVAARVVRVTLMAGQPLSLTLQPGQLTTATAVTDPGRRAAGAGGAVNPYVCKVRLVE